MVADELFAASTPQVPDIELGMYDAKLQSISTTWLDGGQFGEGHIVTLPDGTKVNRFKWVFGLFSEDGEALYEVDDEGEPVSGDPIVVDTVTGLQFFAKAKNPSKQTRIMQALLTKAEREAWENGEGAPTQAELIGRSCQVQVTENSKGYPTAGNVLPPRARRAVGRRAAAAAVASDSEE